MFKVLFFAGLLASIITAYPTADPRSLLYRQNIQHATKVTSCEDVPRSSELKWVPCYDGSGFQKTKTKNPILFVNALCDSVTPLESAEKMAGFFEGSGVLAQDSGGHSPLDTKSSCIYKHVQTYLDTGKVPDTGMVCDSDKKPLVDAVQRRGTSTVDWRHQAAPVADAMQKRNVSTAVWKACVAAAVVTPFVYLTLAMILYRVLKPYLRPERNPETGQVQSQSQSREEV